jgi:hypothetical protein
MHVHAFPLHFVQKCDNVARVMRLPHADKLATREEKRRTVCYVLLPLRLQAWT